jgi:hypothetical protein
LAFVKANPAPTFKKLKKEKLGPSTPSHPALNNAGTNVRIKGRTDVHMRAPVEIMFLKKRKSGCLWGGQGKKPRQTVIDLSHLIALLVYLKFGPPNLETKKKKVQQRVGVRGGRNLCLFLRLSVHPIIS